MADPIIWPWRLLKPQNINVSLAHRNLRGPSASNGFTQVVSNSSGLWKVTFADIPVYSKEMIRCWRAIDALTEGQLYPLSIPVYEYPRSPASTDDLGLNLWRFYNNYVRHSDTSPFSDGSGYQSTYTNVVSTTAGAIGGTTVSVQKNAPLVTLESGHRFSINDRLYQIQKVTAQDATTATFTVRPQFREAFDIGARLEFDLPRVRVKLTSDTAMGIPLNFNRQSFPTLEFIEDL